MLSSSEVIWENQPDESSTRLIVTSTRPSAYSVMSITAAG